MQRLSTRRHDMARLSRRSSTVRRRAAYHETEAGTAQPNVPGPAARDREMPGAHAPRRENRWSTRDTETAPEQEEQKRQRSYHGTTWAGTAHQDRRHEAAGRPCAGTRGKHRRAEHSRRTWRHNIAGAGGARYGERSTGRTSQRRTATRRRSHAAGQDYDKSSSSRDAVVGLAPALLTYLLLQCTN